MTREHRRVLARRQGCHYSRFAWVLRGKAHRLELRSLARIILPVVISAHHLSVTVEQAQGRIGQWISDPRLPQRWPDGSNDHFRGIDAGAPKSEAADDYSVRCLD